MPKGGFIPCEGTFQSMPSTVTVPVDNAIVCGLFAMNADDMEFK